MKREIVGISTVPLKSVRHITPRINPLYIPGLWDWKYLIYLFVRRDFVVYYQQTILGPLWYIANPLLSTVVLTIIFGNIVQLPTDNIPHFMFYFSGTLVWGFFSDCFSRISRSLESSAREFGNAPFPRLTVPVASVISAFIQFLVQGLCFCGIYLLYLKTGNLTIGNPLYILPALLQLIITALGGGLLVAAITSKYRDFSHITGLFIQMLYLCTPVVYPLSMVKSPWRYFYRFNPLASTAELFRKAFFSVSDVRLNEYIVSWCVTLLLFSCGLLVFNIIEKTYIDTV